MTNNSLVLVIPFDTKSCLTSATVLFIAVIGLLIADIRENWNRGRYSTLQQVDLECRQSWHMLVVTCKGGFLGNYLLVVEFFSPIGSIFSCTNTMQLFAVCQ